MPKFEQRLHAVIQRLDDACGLGEALFFPEFSCCAANRAALHATLARLARKTTEASPQCELFGRRTDGPFTAGTVRVEVPAPRQCAAWSEPVQLDFHVVRWTQPALETPPAGVSRGSAIADMPAKADAYLAYVPVLGIEIFATRDQDLEREIPKQILAALRRSNATSLLERLVWLERCRSIEIAAVGYTVQLLTPKETAIKAKQERADEPKVLVKVADEWSRRPQPESFAIDGLVEQLAELLRAEFTRTL